MSTELYVIVNPRNPINNYMGTPTAAQGVLNQVEATQFPPENKSPLAGILQTAVRDYGAKVSKTGDDTLAVTLQNEGIARQLERAIKPLVRSISSSSLLAAQA